VLSLEKNLTLQIPLPVNVGEKRCGSSGNVSICQQADLARSGNFIKRLGIETDISVIYSGHNQPPSHSTIIALIVIATITPKNGMTL